MTLLFSYIIEVIKMIYEITKHKIKWVKIITVVINSNNFKNWLYSNR